jgi:hypothetical protein
MKRRNTYTWGLFLAVISFLLVYCEKKEDEEVDPVVGTYTFTSATFNDTVRMKIMNLDVAFLPGTNAALFISEGLFGAAPCDDSLNAAVDLRADGTTHYVCLNETGEAQMGTWIIDEDRTTLLLNISNPQPFSLTVSNLNLTANSFSGTVENFPLPIDASFELGEQLPGGGVNYQISSVDLTFTRVP